MQVRSTAATGENDVVVNNRKFETARYSHDKYLMQNTNIAPSRAKIQNILKIIMSIPTRYQNPKVELIIDWTKSNSVSIAKLPNTKSESGINQRTNKRTMTTFIQKSTRLARFVLSCINPPC